ncbi:MAG: asparagine synthase (glutamine-hydrolyzing), partial [Thiotrichaceae bacterium]
QTIKQMTDAIANRGPDDDGSWIDDQHNLALGHRRLSIIDLSQAGHQPMTSHHERYVIAFNGEIYNFQDIRKEINEQAEYQWRGHSDTEVILAAVECWGVESTLKRLVGMFAFSLWDKEEEVLYLARDRMGEKPLYYGWQGGSFMFGSELKSLRAHPAWQGEINRNALSSYLRHNYVPAPYSIYSGINKLIPGTYLKLSQQQVKTQELPEPIIYWSIDGAVKSGLDDPFTGTPEQAVSELDGLLRQSIEGQMIADVPLGAFLSGGIDSSTVVALMQDSSDRPVNTFSIGFHEDGYNEAQHASLVAKHLKTNHTELYVTAKQARDVIPKIPSLYDEPFADSSQIPTYLVSEMARKEVTVSLSGDAGDELFCGYGRYQRGNDLWQKINKIPLRKLIGSTLKGLPSSLLNSVFFWADRYLNGAESPGEVAYKIKIIARMLQADNKYDLYYHMLSQWKDPDSIVIGATETSSIFHEAEKFSDRFKDDRDGFMYIDQHSYLPDDILTKVDRAAMGVSLEGRIPMLDHRLIEFAWRLPTSIKVRDGQEKWPLRQVLYQHVPASLIDRPKMGFGVPIDSWLRNELKPWAEELLNEKRLQDEGFFKPELIRLMWNEHQTGKRDWHYPLWVVLMFQQWYESQ